MSVYVVTYDLRQPGRNYSVLYAALNMYEHCHGLESVWFVDSSKTATNIRDHLNNQIDANDMVFVGELQKHWASQKNPCVGWLKDASRSW